MAEKLKGTDRVAMAFFGEGASNEGIVHETMNLASLWSLPIVFLVENNLYGMGTAIERHSAVTDLSHKAEGLGVPGERVDGMDVAAIRECVADHLEIARRDRRPTLVEAFTYRYRGHSAADPEVYREKQEVEEWQRRDPIESFARRLIEAGTISEDDLAATREAVEAQVLEAVEFADASPEPPLDSLYDNLYVFDGDHEGWYAVDERTPDPFRGEREREAAEDERIRELHEAGAAYGGENRRSSGGSGEGPATEAEVRPTDEAQEQEEDSIDAPAGDEQAEASRQQGPGGVE